MSVTDTVGTRMSLVRWQPPAQRRPPNCCGPLRCVPIIITILLVIVVRCSMTTTAYHINPSASSLPILYRSNLPIETRPSPSTHYDPRRYRSQAFQWKLSSNKNQWDDDIIISPTLSEYFSKQPQPKQQQQQPSAASTSAITEIDINVAVEKPLADTLPTSTGIETASPTSSSLLSLDNDDINTDDIWDLDDSNTVKEIVVALQATIENGSSKNKNMLSDIMTSIQHLQRIQQQWKIRNDKNNSDDEKLILMKNPKKRSIGSTKKKKGELATVATASVTTTTTTQRSSVSCSTILQRLKQTTSNNNENGDEISYRLLWVGSDDTISAFGTGLHKVPLARLQEVFLSISIPSFGRKSKAVQNSNSSNRFRLTTTEVIRILGPFPNIKNTLQGTCTVSSTSNGEEQWNITWNSMIDGTGKELIGSSNDDVRHVPTLNMLYGDEQIIVAYMTPPERFTSRTTDSNDTTQQHSPISPAMESILLFVREIEMEDKLTALRVL
jgi:hypothetical protein